MATCPQCKHDSEQASYAFCTQCGAKLEVSTVELPTLPNVKASVRKENIPARSVEDENRTLRKEIERLKETSAVLFGKTEESASKRVSRILAVMRFDRNILGEIEKGYFDQNDDQLKFSKTRVEDYLNNFKLYSGAAPNDFEQDPALYVAVYGKPADLETELADIRQLIANCDERRVGVTFVIATNEDLREHRTKIRQHFNEIRTTVPASRRSQFRLQIWDQSELRKLEYKLKIRVEPKKPRRGAAMKTRSTKV